MRLLVVEDDVKLLRALKRGLEREGHSVDLAGSGDEALARARSHDYDAVVLDVMLPGLDAGADDYLVKPFDFGELPVDRMTSKAEEIGIDRLHERIALPRARDEIGHLAETLNAMLDRLEHGVEEKHRLVADASHELRTPLAAMHVELDVSLMGDDLSPEAREALESTREEVHRMSRTVDNLLTLARVDEGRLELLTTRVSLVDAIEAAARPLFGTRARGQRKRARPFHLPGDRRRHGGRVWVESGEGKGSAFSLALPGSPD